MPTARNPRIGSSTNWRTRTIPTCRRINTASLRRSPHALSLDSSSGKPSSRGESFRQLARRRDMATTDTTQDLVRPDRDPLADVELLDVEETARRLGTEVRFVRRLVSERRIRFYKVGKYVRFDP